MNDPQCIFRDSGMSEEEIEKWGKYMLRRYKFRPLPSQQEIDDSRCGLYHFGFFVPLEQMRKLCIEWKINQEPYPELSDEDIDFLIHYLSAAMNHDYVVEFKAVLVGEQQLEMVRKDYEDARVGDEVDIVSILSTDHYRNGYRPTNREVLDLQNTLDSKPCWWEAAR